MNDLEVLKIMSMEWQVYPQHFKRGLKWGYPVCCILYFQYVHSTMKYIISEMQVMAEKDGYIMCPDCIVDKYGNTR